MNHSKLKAATKASLPSGKQRSYSEIIELLDANWSVPQSANNSCITQLDMALGKPSEKIDTILVAGTNGKSLTMHFATKLLLEEGVSIGAFSAPHILTYNERFTLNGTKISNKAFTDIANEVLHAAATLGVQPNSFELLTVMALAYFAQNNVDVALLEGCEKNIKTLNWCKPCITAITRVTSAQQQDDEKKITQVLEKTPSGSWVVSADQNKSNLHLMLELAQKHGAQWAMPIRKLVPLNYPFEQLHGRCASLAERIAYIYVNQITSKDAVIVSNSLLTKPKARRGRPTLEAKKQAELNPQKTLEQFWKEDHGTLPGRFQMLDKEKPTVILDTADNVDAIKNLLLGVRLLHYQRPLQGLTLILGGNNEDMNIQDLLKELRYFFKKTSGQVILCPVQAIPGQPGSKPWDIEKIANDLRSMKIKASVSKNFKEAFTASSKSVDDKHGIVVVAGSPAIVTTYWHEQKDMKKL